MSTVVSGESEEEEVMGERTGKSEMEELQVPESGWRKETTTTKNREVKCTAQRASWCS